MKYICEKCGYPLEVKPTVIPAGDSANAWDTVTIKPCEVCMSGAYKDGSDDAKYGGC